MRKIRVASVLAVLAASCLSCPAAPGAAPPSGPLTAEQVMEWARSLPPGAVVDFEQTVSNEAASATGASGRSEGDNATLGIDGSAPVAHTAGGTGARGGDVAAKGRAEAAAVPYLPIVVAVLGVGLLGGAAWLLRRGAVRDAALVGGLGAGCVAVAFFPWLILPAALLAAGVLALRAVPGLAAAADGRRATEALRAVVAGVHDAETDRDNNAAQKAAETIKTYIAAQAEPADKDTIREIKRRDALS